MKRILCWDDKFIEQSTDVSILQHKPEKKNIALYCDDVWEGVHNGYACIIKVGNTYRMYYRATGGITQVDETLSIKTTDCVCIAESLDGIHFKKPNVGLYTFNGSKDNNIVFCDEAQGVDNFSVYYDENPNCPADEKFKALKHDKPTGARYSTLHYYASADGYSFRMIRELPILGCFDSYNLTFWDEATQQYFLYFRHYHHPDGTEVTPKMGTDGINSLHDLRLAIKVSDVTDIRDVRVATSKDFVNWDVHGYIRFEEGQQDVSLYTNQVTKYFRDKSTFIGFPVRYVDRANDKKSFEYMPLADRRAIVIQKAGRTGTALTDCIIMTSQDGFLFNRRDDAFLTPGLENRYNWNYGNCYVAHGLIETEADDGRNTEISFYVGENYRIKNVHFRRYTIRLDGFFSWYAHNAGGEIITKPFTWEEENMFANFASSVRGGMKIFVLDENGSPIDGYESYTIFGDTTNRPIEFDKPLSALKGKKVKLKISLQDCHLYSLTFA